MKQIYHRLMYWDKNGGPEKIAVLGCLGMSAGLLFSRALMSFFMLVLFLNALRPGIIKQSWQSWRKSPFALFSLAFFLIYLLSGLWSANKDFWLASTINKLPFAVLPFAFLGVPLQKIRYQRIIIAGLAFMQMLVIIYSLMQLGLHLDYYVKGYQFSRPLPTTKYDDHIRFSMSLVLSLLMFCSVLFERQQEPLPRWLSIFLFANMVLFIVYIHILAAKTGLVCLYLMAIAYILFRLSRNNRLLSVCLSLLVLFLPVVAYKSIPTFETKINYVFYEIAKSRSGQRFDYTLSDAGRMITYELGSEAIAAHPLAGVGAGDVMDEMKAGYSRDYPEVTADQQYGPINQFMYTALSVGIPLALFLVALVFAPFFIKKKRSLYLGITTLIMLVSLMVESMLELQFGVFTYLFFTLFWMSAGKDKTPVSIKPIMPCLNTEEG